MESRRKGEASMRKIIITAGTISLPAELNAGLTATLIWEALPFEGPAQLWGDEIYFSIPVLAEQELGARQAVEVGELAYWPLGNAFCIFFGPTPISEDDKPRAYSPVNVFGRITGNVELMRRVKEGTLVRVTRAVGDE
jgi:hypothetical protein